MPTFLTTEELAAKFEPRKWRDIARQAEHLGLKRVKRDGRLVLEIPDGFNLARLVDPILPAVRKTPQMQEIEQRHDGQDIRLIIKDLYEKTGTQMAVAKELGLEQSVINIWAARLGINFHNQPTVKISGIDLAPCVKQLSE